MKRLLALLCVLTMMISLGASAFAGDDGIISVTVATAGGEVSGGGTTFNYPDVEGESKDYIITATPYEGFQFEKWILDGDPNKVYTGESFRSLPITLKASNHNRSAEAHFIPIKKSYTITASADPSAGGSVSGGGTYEENSSVTLTATANDGYSFIGWADGVTTLSREITVTADVAKTYTANFEINKCKIQAAASPAEGGSISYPSEVEHDYSTTEKASFTATANSGYSFVGWYQGANLLTTSETVSTTFNEPKILTAMFSKNSSPDPDPVNPGHVDPEPISDNVTVSVSVNPAGAGTATGAGSYPKNSTVILAAIANSNYIFDKWSIGADQFSTSNPYSFTATENVTVVANFIPVTAGYYTITYKPGPYGTGSETPVTWPAGPAWVAGQLFTRYGYTQVGWSTTETGGKIYDLDQKVTLTGNVTLYPVWQQTAGPLWLTLRTVGNGVVRLNGTNLYDGWGQNLWPNTSLTFTFVPGAGNYVYSLLLAGWYRQMNYGNQFTVDYNMMRGADQTLTVRFASVYSPPKTGDNSNLALWIALGGLSAVALGALIFMKKKK